MSIPVLMPALSPTMEEGTLAKWLVKEGDDISPGDIIAEIETDKATMEFEAVDEGRMGKIVIPEGTEGVPVNDLIAVILEEGDGEDAIKAATEKHTRNGSNVPPASPIEPKPAEESREEPSNATQVMSVQKEPRGERIFVSPLARRLAEQSGLDLKAVTGTGPHGRIIKRDIEEALKKGTATVQEPTDVSAKPTVPASRSSLPDARAFYEKGTYNEVPHDSMRKTIARRLTQAKQELPHFRVSMDCEIDELLSLRKELNAKSPEGEDAYKISVNDFVIRALALALRKVPNANASWTDDAMLLHQHADIGVAVAIDGGLITPIVKAADTKGLAAISREMVDLAERARTKKLKPTEYEGGSFAVSNLGMFGVDKFDAVINPPHAGILAVGAGSKRPIVKDDALTIATIMTVNLSCDHRVIDGALGAQLLGAFKGFIEDPVTMLL